MLIAFSMFKLSLLTCQQEGKILTGLSMSHCSVKADGIKELKRTPSTETADVSCGRRAGGILI